MSDFDGAGTNAGAGAGNITLVPTVPPTPPAAPDAPSAPDFNSVIPAEFQNELWVKDLARADKPFNALFEQMKNAQSMIGKKGVSIPGENATQEEMDAFRKAMGVPEAPDKYEYKAPDISTLPKEVQDLLSEEAKDDSMMKAVKEAAHKAGVTPKQFQALAAVVDNWKIENAKAVLADAAQQKQTAEAQRLTTFKSLYGDKSDEVERVAKDTIAKVIPENILKTGDPDLVLFEAMRFIHEKVFRNGTILPPSGNTNGSKADIQAQIDALRKDSAFNDAFDPRHQGVRTKAIELYKLLAGS